MGWTDYFEQENNFESKIKEAINYEIHITSMLPKMEAHVKDKELKERLRKFRDKTNVQLQRLEELCDVYDIPLLGRTSIEVETILNEMDDLDVQKNGVRLSTRDIEETAKEMELKEKFTLNKALSIAKKLGYEEAIEILNVSVTGPQFFNKKQHTYDWMERRR